VSEQTPKTWTVERVSELPIPPGELWQRVGSMDEINRELMPWLRMTTPSEAKGLRIEDAPLGTLAFHSWILLFGFVPVDRHALVLIEMEPPTRFLERSSSWVQRVWEHERELSSTDTGTKIRDRVEFRPRLGFLGPLVVVIIAWVFDHRHRQLRSQCG
jgi:hypothetical protein